MGTSVSKSELKYLDVFSMERYGRTEGDAVLIAVVFFVLCALIGGAMLIAMPLPA